MKNVNFEDLKVMSLDEFVNIGLLQEINRQFLHPMGLAISVNVDEESGRVLSIGNIWDFRNDLEGMCFADEIVVNDEARAKCERVEEMLNAKKIYREKHLGYHIQPLKYVPRPKEEK